MAFLEAGIETHDSQRSESSLRRGHVVGHTFGCFELLRHHQLWQRLPSQIFWRCFRSFGSLFALLYHSHMAFLESCLHTSQFSLGVQPFWRGEAAVVQINGVHIFYSTHYSTQQANVRRSSSDSEGSSNSDAGPHWAQFNGPILPDRGQGHHPFARRSAEFPESPTNHPFARGSVELSGGNARPRIGVLGKPVTQLFRYTLMLTPRRTIPGNLVSFELRAPALQQSRGVTLEDYVEPTTTHQDVHIVTKKNWEERACYHLEFLWSDVKVRRSGFVWVHNNTLTLIFITKSAKHRPSTQDPGTTASIPSTSSTKSSSPVSWATFPTQMPALCK